MKRIITLSMIKNESDIIEKFIRYTSIFAYKMVIIDNGSTDGTLEIVKALKDEGLNMDLYIEANSFYEQIIIENKYKRIIEENEDYDYIVPLDADEFLYPTECMLDVFDELSEDKVTLVEWRSYSFESKKIVNDIFVDIDCVRTGVKEFTKVIIPKKLSADVFLTMGHHDVESEKNIERYLSDKFVVAHYPVRSEKQIKLKIYQGILTQLMSSYRSVVAFHWKEMFINLQAGKFDIIEYSQKYALQEGTKPSFKKEPLNMDWCTKNLDCKYSSMRRTNLEDIIFSIAEMFAVRSITSSDKTGKKAVIYGTGGTAKNLFKFFRSVSYEIVAYVDSDEKKEYSTFEGKIVISPSKLKYIDFDCVIIASQYKDDIYKTLLENNISKKKILGYLDLLKDEIYRH